MLQHILRQDTNGSKKPVVINNIPIDIIIGAGASTDILDEKSYHKVNCSKEII